MSLADLLGAPLVPRQHEAERCIPSRGGELGLRDRVAEEWTKAWRQMRDWELVEG